MAAAQLVEKSKNRVGDPFNMFVALEVQLNQDHRNFMMEVEDYQARTLSMFPEKEAKAAKLHSLHITVATLSVLKDELPFVTKAISDAVDHFKRVYSGEDGIRCSFQGVSTYRDIVFLEMSLGANAFRTLKDILMVNGLHRFVTDQTQNPHLTYIRKLDLTDEEKESMVGMMSDIKTSRITLDTLSLRERKQAGEPTKPPVKEYQLWRE